MTENYVAQVGDNSIPIEVKSATNTQEKSLKEYAKNFGFENGIKSVPLYAVWCVEISKI